MPIVRIELAPGRTTEQKRDLTEALTRTTVETLKCHRDSVDVLIIEIPKTNWSKGGKLLSD